jgi:hypothetical protein
MNMIGVVIDNETSKIINRIEIEPGSDWLPEAGTSFVLEPDDAPYTIGGTWASSSNSRQTA